MGGSQLPPAANHLRRHLHDPFCVFTGDPEVDRDFPGEVEVEGAFSLRNIQTQTGPVGIRVEVVGGGEPPSIFREEESVVAEMVVSIARGDGEDDAGPELREIFVRSGSVAEDLFGQLQVTHPGAGTRPVVVTEQGHGGGEMAPATLP